MRWGGWELRGGLGLFAIDSRLRAVDLTYYDPIVGYTDMAPFEIDVSPAIEVSASLSRDLGERWGVSVTGAVTHISQDWHNAQMTTTRDEDQRMWVLSLRRRI
jgi:hypothetical protein